MTAEQIRRMAATSIGIVALTVLALTGKISGEAAAMGIGALAGGHALGVGAGGGRKKD